MIIAAVALALTAAGMHAAWNILLKTSGDPLHLSSRAAGISAVLATPGVAAAWLLTGRPGMPLTGWLLAGLSGAVEAAYYIALSTAYRRGELSAVYPIARGTAPVMAAAAGVAVLGERLSDGEAIGIVCMLLGIWAVQRPMRAGSATVPALLTGLAIAAYSTLDRVGVRLAPPWLYGWALWAVTAVLLRAIVLPSSRRRATWRTQIDAGAVEGAGVHSGAADGEPGDEPWRRVAVVGFLMTAAYLLVLIALSIAPLAVVAPVRESAIVLVTGWGMWRLGEGREASPWTRVGGAAVILAGLVLVAGGW